MLVVDRTQWEHYMKSVAASSLDVKSWCVRMRSATWAVSYCTYAHTEFYGPSGRRRILYKVAKKRERLEINVELAVYKLNQTVFILFLLFFAGYTVNRWNAVLGEPAPSNAFWCSQSIRPSGHDNNTLPLCTRYGIVQCTMMSNKGDVGTIAEMEIFTFIVRSKRSVQCWRKLWYSAVLYTVPIPNPYWTMIEWIWTACVHWKFTEIKNTLNFTSFSGGCPPSFLVTKGTMCSIVVYGNCMSGLLKDTGIMI